MYDEETIATGIPASEAKKAIIMLHGRGGLASDMLMLKSSLNLDGFCIIIPQAPDNEWYPHTFLSPPSGNEPWLSCSIQLITGIINELNENGIASDEICFLGFSQGACLALEYTARFAVRYRGIVSFTGGLIGDRIYNNNYQGDFKNTPVFMGSSSDDPHVPRERITSTAELFRKMNADVTLNLYPGSSHTVTREEIDHVNRHFFDPKG